MTGEKEQTRHLIRTSGLKTTVDASTLYIVRCQVTVDNKCQFEHSSFDEDCTLWCETCELNTEESVH